MGRGFLRVIAAFCSVSVSVGAAHAESAGCWTTTDYEAAGVREMETMLMVAALRCRTEGGTLLADYNAFVNKGRPALVEINNRLRTHFARAVGPAKALNAYDGFVTSLANRYGAGAAGLKCSDMESILSAAVSEAGSIDGLIRLARDAQMEPVPATELCAVGAVAAGK